MRSPGRPRTAADLLHDARARERAGCIAEAMGLYDASIEAAERDGGAGPALAEALRRLAILKHQGGAVDESRALCVRSHAVAVQTGHDLLAGEALNTMGVQDLTAGRLDEAAAHFLEAIRRAGPDRELGARVEQNLGIVANIRGDLTGASERYARSLEAYRAGGNQHGCAIAYCNMGMVSADLGALDDAEAHFRHSLTIAESVGDLHLQGLCRVNQAEVDLERQRYAEARRNAEAALALFDQLGARGAKADAYRVLGMVYRETGRPALAESRLRSALDLALTAGAALNQAEASRELALLYLSMGRNIEALELLHTAHGLFQRMDAQVDLVHVAGRVADLEGAYRAVVREWGQSIESADSYTYGHCGRVAENAVAVAVAMGLDASQRTTVQFGAYLHDVGKVKVPHEILNKPGPLTRDEYEMVQMHTVLGVELIEAVEFPWDLKAVIRWHHEKYDGTGYPDRLRGDEIPVTAQIVGIVDVYDALTTTRSYRGAMTPADALAEIARCRGWWSSGVYDAFRRVFVTERVAASVPADAAAGRSL